MNKELEILAPAGNLEIFKNNIDAGADAIYFGGEKFGARAYADNFSFEDAELGLKYAHLRGRKAYLTVNTLLKNVEIERELYDYIKTYYELGLDAVIVQDFGVFNFIKEAFPEISLHASTQMTIANKYGADYLQKCGADRIVTAREMSLDEIRDISQKTSVEIETFVHGALCYGYSGQCLMSSLIGGRSGNRGRCAQPCRLPYSLLDSDFKKINTRGEYLLSPKDLCGINHIAEMDEAGIYSLKIEGRMKKAGYAGGVVSMYRKYVDAYISGDLSQLSKADEQKLYSLGNRSGFTDSYFFRHNDSKMMASENSSFENTAKPEVILESKVTLNGTITAKIGDEIKFQISYVSPDNGEEVSVCVEGDIVQEAVNKALTKEQILEKAQKTGNTDFIFENINIHMDDNIFMPISRINDLRRRALEEVEKSILQSTRNEIKNSQDDVIQSIYVIEDKDCNRPENIAYVRDHQQMDAVMKSGVIDAIICDFNMVVYGDRKLLSSEEIVDNITRLKNAVKASDKELVIALPIVYRKRNESQMDIIVDSALQQDLWVLASSYDEIAFLEEKAFDKEKIILDSRLYTFSNIALKSFESKGYCNFTAPVELNKSELAHRINKNSYLCVYGRICMMVTANCQVNNSKGCTHIPELNYLQDRYKMRFPVRNVCGPCYNEIYNSKIYNIMSEAGAIENMGFGGLRLDFTIESYSETKKVLQEFENVFYKNKASNLSGDIYTKGHWKRGVE
ncbi:MAG: U32 family peptidase [Lachnospiraceae bacterium]|nr:U32 family peptidase [Lachnospiraceae bacterium]